MVKNNRAGHKLKWISFEAIVLTRLAGKNILNFTDIQNCFTSFSTIKCVLEQTFNFID